jgi:glc operon protein GlcG
MMNSFIRFALTAVMLGAALQAQAQVATRKVLTLDGAQKVLAAALAEARRLNAPGSAIAIVDDGGHPVLAARLDNTFAAGATISLGKARTSALFRKPTKFFEDIVNKGRTTMVALPDQLFTPLQGGVPITVDGEVVGAIGVSGAASAPQDEEIAIAGAKALSDRQAATAVDPVAYFDAQAVNAAFSKGQILLRNSHYKVDAGRRTEPGLAEVHAADTDVIYVVEGAATVVTGGTVTEPRTTAPGEIRGRTIEGGETRRIARGDVLVIPAGTPHWFREVEGPLLYYVVKSTAEQGG